MLKQKKKVVGEQPKNAKAKKEVGEQRWLGNWETGKLGNSRKCEYFTLIQAHQPETELSK